MEILFTDKHVPVFRRNILLWNLVLVPPRPILELGRSRFQLLVESNRLWTLVDFIAVLRKCSLESLVFAFFFSSSSLSRRVLLRCCISSFSCWISSSRFCNSSSTTKWRFLKNFAFAVWWSISPRKFSASHHPVPQGENVFHLKLWSGVCRVEFSSLIFFFLCRAICSLRIYDLNGVNVTSSVGRNCHIVNSMKISISNMTLFLSNSLFIENIYFKSLEGRGQS